MDSEKTTLSDSRPEHEAEYNDVLGELRDSVFRTRPSDVYQFCASYFDQKLSEQREGLLKIIDMHPSILDSTAQAKHRDASTEAGPSLHNAPRESGPESGEHDDSHMRMRHASEHAWSSTSNDVGGGLINPNFSFGPRPDTNDMTVDDETAEEARDKFNSLVSMPPVGSVQPFAGRRFSVSAESMNPTTEPEYKKKFVPKTDVQKQRIREALDNNFLFKNMDEDSYRDVIDAMEEKRVEKGQSVIVQGGVGDYFYIVERGSFDIFVRKGDAPPTLVATVADSGSFGELALMYNAPRAATVTATSDATLWALDRITFRSLLMERTSRKRRLYERFLETVPLLKSLESYERQKIADALESVTYEDNDAIVKQGDPGDDFFLIEQGTVRVYKTDTNGVSREFPPLTQG
ncbi:hypothetical protein H4S00_005066, partial [Coemansia sp. D1744]